MRDGGYGKSVMMTVAVGDNGGLRQLRQTWQQRPAARKTTGKGQDRVATIDTEEGNDDCDSFTLISESRLTMPKGSPGLTFKFRKSQTSVKKCSIV